MTIEYIRAWREGQLNASNLLLRENSNVKNAAVYTSTPSTLFWHGIVTHNSCISCMYFLSSVVHYARAWHDGRGVVLAGDAANYESSHDMIWLNYYIRALLVHRSLHPRRLLMTIEYPRAGLEGRLNGIRFAVK